MLAAPPSPVPVRAAFSPPLQLPPSRAIRAATPPRCPTCPQVVCAKKRSNRRRKRSDAPSSKPAPPQPTSASQSPPSEDAFATEPAADEDDAASRDAPVEELPIANEARLRLPDLKATSRRRKRKPLQKPVEEPVNKRDVLATEAVQRLTQAYRAGGAEAQKVIYELEKDPDYFLQTGNAKGEYDFASALIGTGKPNKQGIYVLPYLQSGHILLLGIALLIAFVYYPGFPLTEANDQTRDLLKKGLALVAVVNAVLAVYAYRAAKLRAQPPFFWAFKTAFLGNLAFNELKSNAPVVRDDNK